MPDPRTALDGVRACKYLAVLNLKSGFHPLLASQESRGSSASTARDQQNRSLLVPRYVSVPPTDYPLKRRAIDS